MYQENVAEFVKNEGKDTDTIVKEFQEMHSKYSLMDVNLTRNRNALMRKIPEIKKTLKAIEFLKEKMVCFRFTFHS